MSKLLAKANANRYSTGHIRGEYIGPVMRYMQKHPMAECLLSAAELKILADVRA